MAMTARTLSTDARVAELDGGRWYWSNAASLWIRVG